MAGFLFWNLYGNQSDNAEKRAAAICESLTRLVRKHSIDVLVFAEYRIRDEEMAKALNAASVGNYFRPISQSSRIALWTRLPEGSVIERYKDEVGKFVSAWEIRFPTVAPILLFGFHPHDRSVWTTEASRALKSTEIARSIRNAESNMKVQRTIVVGDFNMNPYEAGVVGTEAFHAVMTRELAYGMADLTARAAFPCFYNPMWSCFGDNSPGSSGSYYWPNNEDSVNHFWQIYDQVLIRTELVRNFMRVEILSSDGVESLVTQRNRPRKQTFSDHLPIYFEFDFTGES